MASPLDILFSLFSVDVGIDLGTANTLVYVRGKGIVINEPSVIAVEKPSKKPVAIGVNAKEMIGRTPGSIVAIRPLKDGVISEFERTEEMLREFINKVHSNTLLSLSWFQAPRVVIGVPSGVTEVEKRAVYDAARNARARDVQLIPEPIAAAIGAGLPVTEPFGSMVVDIGGGTTEVAVFSLRKIVVSRSIRVAGDELNEAIINYARQKYNLLIGLRMAERCKITIGSAYPLPEEQTIILRGRNLITGLPDSVEISSIEVREALSDAVQVIVDAVRDTLDETPPELIADLMESGIVLAGGGSLLQGIVERLSEETKMRVYIAEDPLTCVARGAGLVLESPTKYEKLVISPHRSR